VPSIEDEGRIPECRLSRTQGCAEWDSTYDGQGRSNRQNAAPTNVSELRAVFGTANYYRKFVENYSTIATPLNNLLREDVAWQECQKAFDTIKE
jgi:hypothetical protein